MRPIVSLLHFALLTVVAAQVHADENAGVRTHAQTAKQATVESFIVKLRPSLSVQAAPGNAESGAAAQVTAAKARVTALAARMSMTVDETHPIGPNMHVMRVTPMAKGKPVADMLARLSADTEVEYAVEDRHVIAHAVPNDPLFAGQWHLQTPLPPVRSAIDVVTAWDTTKGDDNTVIAVIDTGVRYDHPDLTARLLTGYDFITPLSNATDGDARDGDATDTGDFCGTDPIPRSSWHGTRVSGIIGASSNNARGVTGITWNGKILPVRVIGACGGLNSDVIAGLNWAAGITFPGAPALPPTTAKILNVSLGAEGPCDPASRDAIAAIAAKGVLVVVSAGNEAGPVDTPANCPGAMAVAGLRHIGTKVGYSSLGPEIAISAPAGNCPDEANDGCAFSIDTTINLGETTPIANSEGYSDKTEARRTIGTSFSSPIVAGIAGLMLGVNSNLKAPQLIARIREGASPFPTTSDTTIPAPPGVCGTPSAVQGQECICTTAVCGAGMANANGAVQAALRPIADIVVQGAVAPGANVTLQGGGSTAAKTRSISSYSWLRGGDTISSSPTANITAPASGSVTVCLTVSDDVGKQDSAKVVVTSTGSTVSTLPAGSTECTAEVSVSATDATAGEGGDTGTFTFTRTGSVTAALTVNIALAGTALNGTDYQSIATTVVFNAGSTTAAVTLTPVDNATVNGTRSATVTIQSGTGYAAGSPNAASITIADNDTAAPAPPVQQTGGGGGGALDQLMLMGLALAVLAMLLRSGRLSRRAQQLAKHIASENGRARR
jgi:serine protease